nr:reverse transcriptase domain-containing protein [Tanacetum cinerariifolium]
MHVSSIPDRDGMYIEVLERNVEVVRNTSSMSGIDKGKLKAARDCQKSYADKRRKPLEFEVDDQVLLKVSHWKGEVRFGKNGKLAPRYVGLFEILERVVYVAYRLRLRLPKKLSREHEDQMRIKYPQLFMDVGNKMHKAFPLLDKKFPLLEGTSHCLKMNATVRRIEMPLPEVCTAIEEKKKKLIVKDRWQLH